MLSPTHHTARRVKTAPPSGTVDVAIVGAGLGGMTAAAYLARAGFSVALFDGHYVAGGCATMFERGKKNRRYCFDVGLHYIGDCGPGGGIPTVLGGLDIDIDYVPMDQDGFDTLVFPDFEFKIPASKQLYRDRLVALFPREKRGIDRYIRFLDQVERIARRLDSNAGQMNKGTLLDVLLHGRLLARYQNATLEKLLDSCTSNQRLRAIIAGQHGDYGLPPSRVSALLHAGLANHYFAGAYYPRGGGQIIADKIADDIEAHGGTIALRHLVQEILVQDGKAVGLRVKPQKGEPFDVRARCVLSNADIKRTMLELIDPQHLPSSWLSRANGFEMGGAIFMTYLAVNADIRELGMRATNYWQFDDYDFEAYYDSVDEGDVTPRGCYITTTSLKDPDTPGHAPAGEHNIEIMTLVPGRASDWNVTEREALATKYRNDSGYQQRKQLVEDDLVARLEALFPSITSTITFRESASPVTHTRYTRATDGTGYGLAATPGQFLNGRPGYRGPLDGLYLAGSSTRAGHGVVGAMTGGHRCALKIAADFGRSLSMPARLVA